MSFFASSANPVLKTLVPVVVSTEGAHEEQEARARAREGRTAELTTLSSFPLFIIFVLPPGSYLWSPDGGRYPRYYLSNRKILRRESLRYKAPIAQLGSAALEG